MDYKKVGKKLGWNPSVRFTMHKPDGFVAEEMPAFGSRSKARRALRGKPEGYWLKDNINTHFIYEVRRGRVMRVRASGQYPR